MTSNAEISKFPAASHRGEPSLLFSPTRPSDIDEHPLRGLVRFGPYSRSLINNVVDPIRVGIIAPSGALPRVRQFLSELPRRHRPRERHQYLMEFPGVSTVLGVNIVEGDNAAIELPRGLGSSMAATESPHVVLSEELAKAIAALDGRRTSFDVVLIYLPDQWQQGFKGHEDDFDLHDYIKAVAAMRGIPSQVLRDFAFDYRCRCSVMWRQSIALYVKAGGIPWKLSGTDARTAFIGISYAVRGSGEKRFVTCCSQVFDSDGAGLEFLLYESDPVRVERDNPFLSRTEMRRLMARSLRLYQQRHVGCAPAKVVVHKTTRFTPDEIEGCFDAFPTAESIDLLQVQTDTPWRGLKLDPPKRSGQVNTVPGYPIERGTFVSLGGREILLWSQGDVPSVSTGKHYYKEGKGIPSPLLITRHAGHGAWEETVQSILGLSKMNWNNDGLYDREPVTLGYASSLARVVKRMPRISSQPYSLRYFM